MITTRTAPKTTWHQIDNLHRWELRDSARVIGNAWNEGAWWHWSVPSNGLPVRGIEKQFRKALHKAEVAAGVKAVAA